MPSVSVMAPTHPAEKRSGLADGLTRWSIRSRLVAMIGAILLAMAVLGAISVTSLSGIARTSDEVIDKSVVPIAQLSSIRASMKDIRLGTLNYVTSTDPKSKAAQKANKEKAQERLAADLDAYRPNTVDPATLADLEKAWQEYVPVLDPLMAYGDKLDFDGYGKYRDAHALAPSKAADTAVKTLIQKEEERARSLAAEARARADRARLLLIVAVTLTLVAASLAAWLLAKSILKPLQSIVRTLEATAAGDLTARVDVHGRTRSPRSVTASTTPPPLSRPRSSRSAPTLPSSTRPPTNSDAPPRTCAAAWRRRARRSTPSTPRPMRCPATWTLSPPERRR